MTTYYAYLERLGNDWMKHQESAIEGAEKANTGEDAPDRCSKFYSISYDFKVFDDLPGFYCVRTGLEDIIRNTKGKKLGTWKGKVYCHADIELKNPEHPKGFGSGVEMTVAVPLNLDIEFKGSDLEFKVTPTKIAEFMLPLKEATDETKLAYEFFNAKCGRANLEYEFARKAAALGIRPTQVQEIYEHAITEIFKSVDSSPEVREAIREQYRKDESEIPQVLLKNAYTPKVLAQKRADPESAPRRYGAFSVIDGEKQ